MKSAIFKVARNLSFTLIAMSLVSLSAHAKPPKDEGQHKGPNLNSTVKHFDISVVDGTTAIVSTNGEKEISHVIIWYCGDPVEEVKYEEAELLSYLSSDGTVATFEGTRLIMSVVAKAGTSVSDAYLSDCSPEEPEVIPQ